MEFELLEAFQKKELVAELKLCSVLMEDKEFPWILLVPRRPNVVQINQLSKVDQLQLMEEIDISSNIMETLFVCDRLNVAAIGNKTPQLHVHIICRTQKDSLWPETVWGQKMDKLSPIQKVERSNMIRKKFLEIKENL